MVWQEKSMEKVAQAKTVKAKDAEILDRAKKAAACLKDFTGIDITKFEYAVQDDIEEYGMLTMHEGRVVVSKAAYELGEDFGHVSGINFGFFMLSAKLFDKALEESFPHMPQGIESRKLPAPQAVEWLSMQEAYGKLFGISCVYENEPAASKWEEHVQKYIRPSMSLGITALDELMPGFSERFDPGREVKEAILSFEKDKSFVPYLIPRMNELWQLDEGSQQAYTSLLSDVFAIVLSPSIDAVKQNISGHIEGGKALEEDGLKFENLVRALRPQPIRDLSWMYN